MREQELTQKAKLTFSNVFSFNPPLILITRLLNYTISINFVNIISRLISGYEKKFYEIRDIMQKKVEFHVKNM